MTEVQYICSTCGNELTAHYSNNNIYIDPCENCLGKSREEGYSDGLDEGLNSEV